MLYHMLYKVYTSIYIYIFIYIVWDYGVDYDEKLAVLQIICQGLLDQ